MIALGRKNYLFAGADSGGDRAAAMYALLQTAKMNDLNPETYLRNTLAKIAEGHPINKLDELMPWQTVPWDVADVNAYAVAPPGVESEFST